VSAARCPGVTDDGTDDPSEPGLFASPDAFDRSSCGASAAPLDSIDACGIWHLDLEIEDYGRFPVAVRIDLSSEPGASRPDLDGLLFGRPASDVRLTESDLFLRVVGEADDGSQIVRALDACSVDAGGNLYGRYTACLGEECSHGTFTGAKVERLPEPDRDGITVLSEWSGPAEQPWPEGAMALNVRHRETVAYLARQGDGLRIINIADPAHPADLGHSPVRYADYGEYYNDVKIAEAAGSVFALVGSNLRGLVVIDVTDPSAPEEVATVPSIGEEEARRNVHTLFVEGDRVYFTIDAGVEVYSVADPAAPTRVSGYVFPEAAEAGWVHDLYVEDAVAYLNYWAHGMVVVDLSVDGEPALIGVFDDYPRRTSHSSWTTEAAGRRVAVHGDEDYGAHVRIVDIDPASAEAFSQIGAYQTRPEISVHNIMAIGERALVTYYQDGLRVLDLADPTEPAEIAHLNTWPGPEPGYGAGFYEGAIGIDHDPERDLLLLADTHRGLLLLRMDR
jgi:hypothetical protein